MQNKNHKKKNIVVLFGKILYLILVALISILLFKIIKLDVLPTIYLILIVVVLLIVLFGIGFILFKKKLNVIFKIINSFIVLILMIITLFALSYLTKTVDFLNSIKNKLYQTEEYYVLVPKDSKYDSLEDFEDKTIGTYKDEINGNYNNSLVDLLNGMNILFNEYDNYMDAANALMDGTEEAIFISAAYKSIVEDEIENFYDNTKIIYKVQVKIKSASIEKEVNVSKEPFTIFISGIDSYGDISTQARSDVNMLVTINPETYDVLLTSIPRDYYVQLHNTTGYKDKLTHAGIYDDGISKTVQTVEDLLDVDINYYVRVNFTTVVKLVNAIGGVDINSPAAFTSYAFKTCTFVKGMNYNVNGKCTLGFVRERKSFTEGDRQRVKNQQEVIKSIISKAMNSKTIVSKYTKILESFGGSIETNMSTDKIYELVKLQLGDMPSWNIVSQSLDGYDSMEYTYSMGSSQKLSVMIPDEKTITTAKAAIKKILNKVEAN
jgi:LCP family protein required for cell wall assembly